MSVSKGAGYRLMDKKWEEVQKKTFTKWCNSHLVKKFGSGSSILDLEADFADGIKLMELVNCLYGTSFPPKYNKNPKMRPHMLDNIELSLRMLDLAGVKTNFLKPVHLADKDKTMLLGMVWSIILDYQIKGINVEDVSAKDGLLLWCKRKTQGYQDVKITNFTDSWTTGLGFCALIHKHRPDLLNFDDLSKENPRENLELAFEIAEKELGITRLLDASDIVDSPKPDERSIITYVSEYFHYFTSQDQAGVAGRRLGKWVELAKSQDQLRSEYILKANDLLKWIQNKTIEMQDRETDGTLSDIETKWSDLKEYKKVEKPAKTNEKLELESAFNSLQALLRANKRSEFVPPEDITLKAIEKNWSNLTEEETLRAEWLRKQLERLRKLEVLASRFWRKAKALLVWGSDNEGLLASKDCGNSVSVVEAKLKNHETWENSFQETEQRLTNTKNLGQELINEGYGKKEEVENKINELDSMWANLGGLGIQRKNSLFEELERQKSYEQMRLDFANRSRALVSWLEDAEDGEIAEPVSCTSIEAISQLESSFSAFLQEIQSKTADYDSLLESSNQMESAGILENPYSFFTMEQVSERWNRMLSEVNERKQSLESERVKVTKDDALCKEFANLAKSFVEWIAAQKDKVKNAFGTLEEQLSILKEIDSETVNEKSRIDEISVLHNTIEESDIIHNPYTEETIETLKLAYDGLVSSVAKQQALIEREILNQSGSQVSEEQLAEFKETFRTFDKDNSATLERNEFEACLQALGQLVSKSELDDLMSSVCKTIPGKVCFQEFVDFMISRTSDKDAPETMKASFKQFAKDKAYITEGDLHSIPISDDARKFLLNSMPKTADGYDYNAFVDKQYQ